MGLGGWKVESGGLDLVSSDTDSSEAESLGFAMEGWSGWPVCLWRAKRLLGLVIFFA
jgi:hypothetical protein